MRARGFEVPRAHRFSSRTTGAREWCPGTDPPPNDVYAAQPLHVDAGAWVEDNGAYADRLTCRADETSAMGCNSGTIRVRADDGGHLCTANGVAVAEYCAGARRFSEGIRSAL